MHLDFCFIAAAAALSFGVVWLAASFSRQEPKPQDWPDGRHPSEEV